MRFPLAKGTSHRGLYFSESNARKWLRFSSAPEYPGRRATDDPITEGYVSLLVQSAVPGSELNLLSFGSGDGRVDANLVAALQESGVTVHYVPIDISSTLLWVACDRVSKSLRNTIPFTLQCDFEGGLELVSQVLNELERGLTVFSILGNTLGTLDHGELKFYAALAKLLRTGDLVFSSIAMTPYDPDKGRHSASRLVQFCSELDSDPHGRTPSEEIEMQVEEVSIGQAQRFRDRSTGRLLLEVRAFDDSFSASVERQLQVSEVGHRTTALDGMGFPIGTFLFVR